MTTPHGIHRIIIIGALIICPNLSFAAPTPFIPPSGKTLLLVGQDRDTIAQYVKATGNVPGGTMVYTDIQNVTGLNETVDYGSGPVNGDALLRSYPNSVVQVGLYMVNGLGETIDGAHDNSLKKLARWLKKSDRPVYLRIGYEFDLPANHYDPEQYKQAFRYVVDFLRKEGVRNTAFVWHTYCPQLAGESWMDWYPGDDYVDWFGVSLFSTQQIPMASNFLKLAREHGKPFMICESTPDGLYSTRGKIDWFNHVFEFINDQQVDAFCYIDTDWDKQQMWKGQSWGDARVENDPETKGLWLDEIGRARYLKASPDLFRSLGWMRTK